MRSDQVLIALGGNAIVGPGEIGNLDDQFRHTRETMEEIAGLIKDGIIERFVLTHGNGPQIGNIILRSEIASPIVYPLTVDICVSDSQGGMGYMIQQCLRNALRKTGLDRDCATIVTQMVVDRDDPAFQLPTKYIGSFMSEEEATAKAQERGWTVKPDSNRGWRRVIASPEPTRIVEHDSIRILHEAGVLLIAGGGGGIPVVEDENGQLHGVDGVIDKDLASAMIANHLGIPTLVVLTGADGIYTDYGTSNQKHYPELDAELLEELNGQGHFPPGSMGPKVKAALRFLENGGESVVITMPGKLGSALQGKSGTRIIPAKSGVRQPARESAEA